MAPTCVIHNKRELSWVLPKVSNRFYGHTCARPTTSRARFVRNDHDAEDIVQESFRKAFQGMNNFRGGDSRVWLLAIVRNTTMNFLRSRRPGSEVAWNDQLPESEDPTPNIEHGLIQQTRRDQIRRAIDRLPSEFRETFILREMEELSYKEISAVLKIPIGTVMSRLGRARNLLIRDLALETSEQKGVTL